jgi:exodeoxyribonuclease V alpha subunit
LEEILAEIIKGVLERIVFRNDQTCFAIFQIRLDHDSKQIISACGKIPGVNCGELLQLIGHWSQHPKFGQQFLVESFSASLPNNINGIRKYLSSGLIQGINKVYAQKIVDHFGSDTFDVISTEPHRLEEIPGIGTKRTRVIKNAWDQQHALRDILIFLQNYNVPNALCLRLFKIYGTDAKQILQSDPYRVAQEVDGIGFKTADKIAQNLGIPGNHISRIDAGILFTFSNLELSGHTAYPRKEFLTLTQQLLEINQDTIAERLDTLIKFKKINVIGDDLLQTSLMINYESTLAQHLQRLYKTPSSLPKILCDNAITWAQQREGFVFAEEQVAALRHALTAKLSIITGGPGTGKTTILRALVAILSAKRIKIGLGAPTGRAAQKLTETTGIEAKTIHRLLQANSKTGQFFFNQENQLPLNFIIVDEASMLDTRLAVSLFNAIFNYTHLLLVGDIDQLPSVGAGNILADFINSKQFAVTYLKQIFRQGQHSEIVQLAHNIITGDSTVIPCAISFEEISPDHDFHFILANSPEECTQKVEYLCTNILPNLYKVDPINDTQVLVPLHKGMAGIDILNEKLQLALTHSNQQIPWSHFRLGDKVIQLRNNYEKNIFNGDLGIIYHFNHSTKTVFVKFNNESVELTTSELNDIALAYAISIHKSQGSEFPIVVIPLMTQHYIMLQRNLLYTAVTRGRNKVFIVGDPKAYNLAVNTKKSIKRITGLAYYF